MEKPNRQLLIEQDEKGLVNVTTNEEEISVANALLLLKLAEYNVMNYYLGTVDAAVTEDTPEVSA